MQLDHVFIITKPGAEVADKFTGIGLREGTSNSHPGQGTANRRFFLNDFTIELLFISDTDEALNGAGKDLRIHERSQNREASPFGIVVRVDDPTSAPTFPNWLYFPDYFHGKMCFHVGENSTLLNEPLCICMPPSLPKARNVPDELVNWELKLTQLEISTTAAHPSPTLKKIQMEGVTIRYNEAHHMTLTFNNGQTGMRKDLNPDIPLSIYW